MRSGPSQAAEALVALLVPPACREEVVGDLHERYRSPWQYGFEALGTVPLVILSRIRRTADPQVLLMQAFALYLSFLGAARFRDPAILLDPWGLTRLAIPAGTALLGLILEDAYANPARRTPMKNLRGPVVGIGLALLSQGMLRAGSAGLALPLMVLFYGCGMGLFLSTTIRMSFPPIADSLQGVNTPALWLKRSGEPANDPRGATRPLKVVAALAAAGLLLLTIAWQLWK